ncbi:MAG TPA: hypothetical protein VLV86_06530 [Vicinamibacterales bacterium]|nr:hypothetical protein [Vicinamibacterales bacterium]
MRRAAAVLIGAFLVASPSVAFAQAAAQGTPAPSLNDPAITPFELQRLFDSWALLQAQEFLKLGDDQFAKFLPRFKMLQDVRRQALQQRTRVLNDLRKLVNDNQPDDQIKNALKQLQDIDDRAAAETRKAYDGVDQVLDLRQQAKFRIFEEQMERRKLELVTRARQANRANNPNRQR